MNDILQNTVQKKLYAIFVFFVVLLSNANAWADGSKDLYPAGKSGVRGYLRSHTGVDANYPFANHGTHYVYAKVGEIITVASSVQGSGGNSKIILFAPNGTELFNNVTDGKIDNRAAELAGPRFVGEAAGGDKYLPIYHTVTVTGIYRVQFVSTGTSSPTNQFAANANWIEPGGNFSGIFAWDVSVINTTNSGFVKGRVYTNVLNLSNGNTNYNVGFDGIFYVLTKDGFTYKVDNNGNNGIWYTFYANNDGFVNATTQEPLYKSLNKSSDFKTQAHNPNSADTERHITHKLFYTLPSSDLPTSGTGAVPGGTTWLKNPVIEPDVSQVEIVGVDGTPGQVGNKGGYINFEAGAQGQYTIKIESTDMPKKFVTRILKGSSVSGLNNILWDGKGGDGNSLPIGDVPSKVTVQLQGAEVHFPFIDMEYNTLGTKVQLLDNTELINNGNEIVKSDLVYWNDIDITLATNGSNPNPINNSHLNGSTGISSSVNGHIYGIGGTGSGALFGDNRAIDTWTFIKGQEETLETVVTVKIADLEIPSITPSRTYITEVGNEVTFTIKARNNGPSDVDEVPFSFIVPDGFDPSNIVFTGNSCGSENVGLSYNPATRTYSSRLVLPNGCEVEYAITLTVNSNISVDNYEFTATIMRPNDVTDPDATNPNPVVPPTDPFYECENNGLGGICNNIKSTSILFTPPYILEKDAVFNDEDGDGFSKQGETVTYTLTVKNIGDIDIYDIQLEDPMLGGLIIALPIGDTNSDGILNLSEEWIFTISYSLKQIDIKNKGLYNLATVKGKNSLNTDLTPQTSLDPTPLDPLSPNFDPSRPNHTFVPLKGRNLLITNPNIYQKVKRN
ncbi:DUF11 domain-containing protein [Flavobacterium antarcticum]